MTAIKVFLDSMAGYALAKLDFTGKRVVFLLMLILLMVPFAALLIPLWSIAHDLAHHNTYLALILPPLANPLGVFLMRQFILGLPKDLENAARLDGVSEFGIYWRIILPLVKPGLVVLAVIIFTDQFMSFVWPLVAATNDDLQVLTVGVAALRAQGGVNYGLWSAAAVMSLIPIAIFFFALQRQFLARLARRSAQAMTDARRPAPAGADAFAIELVALAKRYGSTPPLAGDRPRHRGGRVPRPARALGLRQEHAAQDHRRPRGRHRTARSTSTVGWRTTCGPATATSRWSSRTTRSIRT